MRGISLSLLLSALLGLLPSVSLADDPYADYRVPAHNWHSWTAGLDASGNHSYNDGFGNRSNSGNLRGTTSSAYTMGFDSDPGSYALGLAVALGGRQDWTTNTTTFVPSPFSPGTVEDRDHGRQANESLTGFVAFTRYPWSAPIGLSLSSRPSITWNQAWFSTSHVVDTPPSRDQNASNATTRSYNAILTGSASVMWGRVRDATPVYQVEVLEQRLREMGMIRQDLSRHAREQLASLYTTQARLAFAHERPTKYFWGELERILREDGVLPAGGLDAYAVQRLLEPITIASSRVARTAGASIGPVFTGSMLQTHSVQDAVYSSASYLNGILQSSSETTTPTQGYYVRDDNALTGLAVSYHRPAGTDWQIDASSQALLNESGRNLFASASASAIWMVSDRWLARGSGNYFLDATGPSLERHAEQWSLQYGAALDYFLEDSWAFEVGVTFAQAHMPDVYRRQESFTVGISYQISGLLNAPGLFAPMQLAPPAH